MTITSAILNLNGSHAADLITAQRDIHAGARALAKLLMAATPHGRDYQCNAPGDYERARGEHYAQLATVLAVRDRAIALAKDLNAQIS